MAFDRDFRVCNGSECEDCPNFEDCQMTPPDDLDEYYDDDEEDFDPDDDGDRWFSEQMENSYFAQDEDFDNMPGGGYDEYDGF